MSVTEQGISVDDLNLMGTTRRIKDPKTIQAMKKPYCELCGQKAYGEPHHIKTRGSGGSDIPENLIQLCWEHHVAAHSGRLSREELVGIVAAREGKTPEEICRIIGLNLRVDQIIVKRLPPAEAGLEELFQALVDLEEVDDDSRFLKGEIMAELARREIKVGEIATYARCSAALVREYIKTYEAFPDESTRVPELSHYHHRLAANTPDPQYWIQEAAKHQWSTRQMREAIKAAMGELMTEEEKMFVKAEEALKLAVKVRNYGGEPWEWLSARLEELLAGIVLPVKEGNAPEAA
ncbi:HNH endonuclease signature motif containing protein [Thermanaeromonas toyohensis]|nr:HNH endonuclease signature motif containing protein [Thermanaeromonas toyohensis]